MIVIEEAHVSMCRPDLKLILHPIAGEPPPRSQSPNHLRENQTPNPPGTRNLLLNTPAALPGKHGGDGTVQLDRWGDAQPCARDLDG
ncbi:hypothetical protein CDD83_10506 [Cordyceps sp. RAO-2017]|nr:hypothetical protein CDD83_10506 [Cordyceps sp. RAO-2017]